ncbi:RNA polymerase sigma factor [Limnoglobus roseus]|uniref:Sigma-70 family RNA polymerase sigma factor n=1 Tax=Limnoglobus roseus TaxID=2598579 RepID=A0A5C1AU42_9BACT|nr:RNA polymerase sigma factor [Limnoglobus roseus]QEL20744.1 sigma-70 family RNA polymerase sigma factor [Limnoglobus roseus]
MDSQDFNHLVDGLRRGDRAAMADLFERYGGVIRAAVRRNLHDRLRTQFDSLDFVQDVWASLLALPPERCTFATPEALAGFLGRVARNKVADVFRQRFESQKYDIAREVVSPVSDGDSNRPGIPGRDPTPSLAAIAAERWDGLLAQLPPAYHPILQMLRDGFTYDEIAAVTGVSVRTVNRVVGRLKSYLGE